MKNAANSGTNSREKKGPVKGVKVRTVNMAMIFLSIALYIVLMSVTVNASKNYLSMVDATDRYISCQEDAAAVSRGSDYLTEQVRLYTVTQERDYIENYFQEANVTRSRENAIDQLEGMASKRALDHIQNALGHSNQLMELEIYAMRLTAEGSRQDISSLPEEVQSMELTAGDAALPDSEKILTAQDMVFGSEYQARKQLITSSINYFLSDVIEATQHEQRDSVESLRQAMSMERVFISILFVMNVFIFIMIIFLIVKPLQVYVKCIKEEKMMEITGAYEFKYLALTYNDIYEINAANEVLLRHQAEHDPLTGLMNRGAFDQIKAVLKVKTQPIALLIIDVDKFKLINDGYGHETGDRVLKKVAQLLEVSFRSTDFPARVGGDEFSVILSDVEQSQQDTIKSKIANINHTLLNPKDGLPQVSLSVGAAFSPKGFSDELYSQADAALYVVKEHGRCGCRFYQEGDELKD